MTSLEEKVKQVEAFYSSLELDLAKFQSQAKYSCLSGCSKCCSTPHIEASVLEMLPLAFHLYKENLADIFYDKISSNNSICILYEPLSSNKGACTEYPFRALVCRLFGYSFTRNKLGDPSIITCKDIKTEHQEAIYNIEQQVKNGIEVPMASNYHTQLSDIDYHLSMTIYPINEAMRLAIEMTMNHFRYSKPL